LNSLNYVVPLPGIYTNFNRIYVVYFQELGRTSIVKRVPAKGFIMSTSC